MSIEESIKDLYIKQNLSRKEVCLKLNITCARLKYIIYKNNLQKLKPKCYIKDVLEKYSIEEIKKYFYSHSSVDTAKYFNMSLDNLKMLMKKFNFHHSVEQKVKIREATCEKMYGVRCVFQRPDVREKCESEESIQKMHQTQIKNNLEKYGCKYVVQRNDVREKIKQTNMRKYGGNGWTCSAEGKKRMSKIHLSKEIQDKTNNTKKLNHSFNSSKIEERCKKELISKYGEDNVLCQYRDNRYPFNCDFYIKSLDLFIEVNYH